MKVLATLFALATIMIAGCTSASQKEEESLKQEITINDSIAHEAEMISDDIEESISKLDSLINEL